MYRSHEPSSWTTSLFFFIDESWKVVYSRLWFYPVCHAERAKRVLPTTDEGFLVAVELQMERRHEWAAERTEVHAQLCGTVVLDRRGTDELETGQWLVV